MSSNDNNVVYYTDRRNVLVESLSDLTNKAEDGRIQAIAVVALTSIGDVEIVESYKNNTDRMALIGATQVLAQHIMAGD
tara:strand:- start:515 stop:751 length:237 start_codon:yes stop_codon:yes gene_type:complete